MLQQAAVYRRRAAHLRSLAAQIIHTPSMSLHLHAGVDTWRGARPDACCSDLARARQAARDAVDELQAQAFDFERRADELDATVIQAQRHDEIEGATEA